MNALTIRATVALLQGAILWWLYRSIDLSIWPATDRGWLIGLIAAAILVPVAHYLVSDLAADRRRFWVLPPLALALFGFGWHHGAWTTNEPGYDSFAFALALFVLVFHALPFIQVWLAHRRWRPHYEELFHHAWHNTLLVAFGGLFCGVFWLLLRLWGELFKMLGIDFFERLFEEAYFAIPATTVAVGVGMQLAGSVERLQSVLRNTLLTMLKWLAPLAILILALFTLALVVKSPDLLLEQRRVISATWLLWLVALTVALLNTAYQDGKLDAPYPRWLGNVIRLVVPLLLPVSLIAAYAIGVRVDSYGFTVARAWGLLVAVIALAYAAGYAWAALGKGSWMARMGTVNVGAALMSVLLLTLMLSPALSPERLAANSQYAQALERQEDSSFRYLRFDSGEYGRARLRELAASQGHPRAEAIRTAAKRELERTHPWYGDDFRVALSAQDFAVFPAGSSVERALLEALNGESFDSYMLDCDPTDPCPLLLADLDRDGGPEALIFGTFRTAAFQRRGDGWVQARSVPRNARSEPETVPHMDDRYQEYLREALATGRFRVRDLGWQVLEIDGRVFVFDDAPASDVSAEAKAPE